MNLPPSTVGLALAEIRRLTAENAALQERNERLTAELHAAERRARDEGERAERAERAERRRVTAPLAASAPHCSVCSVTLGRDGVTEYQTTDGRKWCSEHIDLAVDEERARLAALPPREEED